MTQVNTPYPATAYLTGFLRSRGIDVRQADAGLELFLGLFSRRGLNDIRSELTADNREPRRVSASTRFFLSSFKSYEKTIDPVIAFLQGRQPTLAHQICRGNFLPQGPRFGILNEFDESMGGLSWAFGSMGLQDQAKHLCSLYIDDLADVLRQGVDSRYELSRYAEKLAASAPRFDPLLKSLRTKASLIDRYLEAITEKLLDRHSPNLVGLSVPFPGNVYGAFRMAQHIRKLSPNTRIALGGGYVNTELRDLKDARVFDFVDYITFDDGEAPLLALVQGLSSGKFSYVRTLIRKKGTLAFHNDSTVAPIPFKDRGDPTCEGLPLERYVSLCEYLNPMHRLWSDGRWNKLTLAHGCYWKKCSFCDVSLDYIGRYEEIEAGRVVDRMERLINETGETGFHFVDEAAPPKILIGMAKEIIRRGLTVTWWGNIRFEKSFTSEVTDLLSASGCVAVTGGLEVASDRLLKLMNKGVTVAQVARVTHAFTQSGIMVHAYLMYGFPSQTAQETIDALERVRQLFSRGCLQSAYWHRFAATVHSPVGKNPQQFGITLKPIPSTFANNDVEFEDSRGVDPAPFSEGLKKAIYNYMLGIGLEDDVRKWFDFSVPKARVPRDLIDQALAETPRRARGAGFSR